MKQKLLKLNAVLLMGLCLSSLQGQTTMNVKATDGTNSVYTLSSIRKLTFPSSGNMTITKFTASTDSYLLTGVCYLNFGDVGTVIEATSNAANGNLYLYPNPVVDVLNIQLSAVESQTTTVELLSIDGKLLNKTRITNTSKYQVNVSYLRQGIYLCRLNNGTSIETKKFFKQ